MLAVLPGAGTRPLPPTLLPATLPPPCRYLPPPPSTTTQVPRALPARWHVWYTFAMLFILPVFLAAGWVHKWRVGLIGLLIPLVVLLQYTW